MKLFRRAPREFTVVIGDPWTINGEPTEATSALEVLREIYDTAVYFPVTITVTGPGGIHYNLEMDEHGSTAPIDTVSKTDDADEDPGQEQDESAEAEETHTGIDELVETASTHEELPPEESSTSAPTASRTEERRTNTAETTALRGHFIPQALTGKKTLAAVTGALAAIILTGIVLTQAIGFGGNSEDAQASNVDEHDWRTPLPETETTDQALDSEYDSELWSIEPGEAEEISWFAAGVIAIDGDTIRLHSHLSGDEVATHTIDDADLAEDLHWVTEFYHDEEPAIGLRFEETFVALDADGDTQDWDVPADMEITVYGTTPIMTNASSEEDPDQVTYQALHIGEDDPHELTVNPEMATRAVDDDWIIQLDGTAPRVAMNPVDRSNDETEAHAVDLTAPTDAAEFAGHLDAGHGHSMALWEVDDDLYLGIHRLEGNSAGETTAFIPAPFSQDEATGWAIARGMELTVIGPYAFSLETGELAAYNDSGDFTQGYGPAAVTTDDNDRRLFVVDGIAHPESDRIIGYTGRGTLLVRLTDGSVAAYGESGGTA